MAVKNCSTNNVYGLILAGGVGSRFWPFSRELEPKQFINIIGNESLLQNTIKRVQGLIKPERIFIITNQIHFYELKNQIKQFHIPEDNIILEPEGKNTAPAIGVCARFIEQKNPDAILVVLPSDHYIKEQDKFKACLVQAIECAKNDVLVTIGIKPKKPATGYGYIKISYRLEVESVEKASFRHCEPRSGEAISDGDCFVAPLRGAPRNDKIGVLQRSQVATYKCKAYKVERFLEKPGLDMAKKYAASKKYFWNSGMFVWKAAIFMEDLKRYVPQLYRQLMQIHTPDDIDKVWHKIKPISVDYGVMEHSKRIALIPAHFYWSDLGSWDALEELLEKDKNGNVIQADSIDFESSGICAFSRGNRLIATVGLQDLIIADTPDALLVCNRHKAQDVKKVVDRLKSENRKEHIMHLTDKRPWGSFTVLKHGLGFKIKLIEIEPKKRLSLQSHRKRAEHWVVVSGCAKVTRGKDTVYVHRNQSIYIPQGIKHRLENPSTTPLKIVEVQTGDYLEEDDIKRFDDDYKRAKGA